MEPIRDTKKADELFKKEVFESAIKEYEAILKEATDEDIRFKSFFRICESLTHLFRYGEASQRIMAAEQLPKSRKNQARFLLFKANLLENFLLQYGYIQRKDVVDEAKDKEDIFRWTPDEIHRLIHQTYQELLDFKDELLKMELKEEGYFLNLEKVDFGRYPTLFDFYILKWTKYLLSRNLTEVEDKPEIERFLVKDFNLPVNPQDSPLLLSAELMEEAGRNRSRQDLQAGEEWRMERVLLAEKYYDAFAYSDVEPDGTPKRGLSLADCMKKTIEYLLELMEDFKTAEAKAQAGYHAAIILKNQGQARAGVELCRRVERKFSNTDGARRARVLRREIEMPELSLATRMAMPPARRSLTIMVKNIKLVYLRLYKLDPDVLRAECEQYRQNEYGRNYYRYEGWSDILNGGFLNERWARDWLKNILTLVPLRTWQVDTGDRGDYLFHSMTIDPPDLGPGLYLIAVSKDDRFHVGGSLMSVSILNVTEIVLVGSSGLTEKSLKAYYEFIEGRGGMNIEDEGFRLYLLDGQTGKMIPDAQLMIDTYFYYRQDIKSLSLKTENDGCARLSIPVLAGPNQYNYNHIDPRANYKESCAFWYNRQALNHSFPNPFEIFIELDRPIYRPGHKVQAKAVVVRRTGQGFKSMDNGSIEFYATDPNHKEFFRTRAELNQFGSVGISFDIPAGRLLGRYILNAQFNYGTYQTAVGVPFSVEEYKRPEFEINLEPAGEPYQYGRPVKIKGCVRYYFGGPVPDAIVKYRIKRQPYIPWYYRYWFSQMNASFQELAGGEVKSDEEGNFEIEFIPRPHTENYCDLVPNISLFLVEVEARDSGGRTITACQTYRAGQRGSYFLIEPLKGFYFESEPVEIEIKMLTINDTPIEGQSRCEVYCLRDFLPPEPEYDNYGQWRNLPHLDDQLKDAPNGEMVFKGEALHNKEGRTVVRIAPLRAGAYRIIQRAIDRWGGEVIQSKVFVVVKDLKSPIPINALSIMLVEKEEYKVGETARFIIGSGLGSGRYLIEVWAGQYFLRKIFIDEDIPVRIFEIEVTEEMKGGFTLRWFGVRDLKIYYNQATVAVPWSEKRLQIALEPFKKILPPGQEIEWGMKITDIDNRPVRAEVLALMFDRSLEYYARGYSRWLNSLYSANPVPQGAFYSILAGLVKNVEITEGLLKKLLDSFRKGIQDFQLPDFRTRQTWAYVSRPGRRKIGRMVEQALPEAAPCESESREGEPEEGLLARARESLPAVPVRKEFADTAFFLPHLLTDENGIGRFKFKVPEQLTGWKFKVLAFTKDIKEAQLIEEVVTKKELMVRIDIPRFFREKDQGTISAIVHNEGAEAVEGEIVIEITEDGKLMNEKLNLFDSRKKFLIKPHQIETFNWLIDIPEGATDYKVRAIAISERLADAEERELPILPSRQRLIESVFEILTGSETKGLKIQLKEDPTRINEAMVLQIEPQLALTILNTIPFLVEYPYECIEQILNRYVPLSIVNEIYKRYPLLNEAVKKIPKRNTVTPPWESDDPNRLTRLMETPWVWESEGRPTSWPIIDLLNPAIVETQKVKTFEKLRSAQLNNGAFPWWPGGQPDLYMTLYVLNGLAEAKRYGVEVPADMIDRALGYIIDELPRRLKPEENFIGLVAYASYVLTSFSGTGLTNAGRCLDAVRSWIEFLERHIHTLTPFGKAYLAYTYIRLGNRKRAEEVLDMAMDGACEDPVAGVYWTPEKYSWIWYRDTVEKHAFFLRTLQELRPGDRLIPGMVKWLFFNRKANVWKSTKASAAAIYALLDYMNQIGALSDSDNFNIRWGKEQYSVVVRADEFLDKPMRWQKQGFDITREMNSAEIKKEGKGVSFASLTLRYSTDQIPEASTPGMLEVERRFYRRVKEGESYRLKPISSGEEVEVGEQIEVQIKINTRSQFEYMHLKDPKGAGFEGETLLSGWRYDPLWFYEEPRDSLTNFFLNWLPQGEYILRYRLRPTKPGIYRIGAAILQSMYAPDMAAHSAGFIIKVKLPD